MTTEPMMMPSVVEHAIRDTLARFGLSVQLIEDATILCPVEFVSGTRLHFVFMAIGERKLWRKRVRLLTALVKLGDNYSVMQRFDQEWLQMPMSGNDLKFSMELSGMVRAMAWATAASTNLGECSSLPPRPNRPA